MSWVQELVLRWGLCDHICFNFLHAFFIFFWIFVEFLVGVVAKKPKTEFVGFFLHYIFFINPQTSGGLIKNQYKLKKINIL